MHCDEYHGIQYQLHLYNVKIDGIEDKTASYDFSFFALRTVIVSALSMQSRLQHVSDPAAYFPVSDRTVPDAVVWQGGR